MATSRKVSLLSRDSLKRLRKDRQHQAQAAARFLRSARVDLAAAHYQNHLLLRYQLDQGRASTGVTIFVAVSLTACNFLSGVGMTLMTANPESSLGWWMGLGCMVANVVFFMVSMRYVHQQLKKANEELCGRLLALYAPWEPQPWTS